MHRHSRAFVLPLASVDFPWWRSLPEPLTPTFCDGEEETNDRWERRQRLRQASTQLMFVFVVAEEEHPACGGFGTSFAD